MGTSTSQRTLSNFLWRFFERCGAQLVTFIVSIVLARLLDPVVYGTIALVTAIITILEVLVNSGFATALIQKKNADDLDFSSVFYFNLILSVLLYAVVFFIAPLFSKFYSNAQLTSIIRILGIVIIIFGIKNVQQAFVSRNFLFKKFFFATLIGTIGAAIVGIVMAKLGFGVWALVAQTLFNNAVDTLVLWITVKWRPKKCFSFKRLKTLFSYGWKLLVASLIDSTYTELRQLLIGKFYTSSDLAYYNRGNTFPKIIVTNINSSIDSVLLPTMSQEQERAYRVKQMTRKSITLSSFLIFPMMVGLAVCAKPIVLLLLTEKWLGCVPFIQIFCISFAFYPIHTANLNAIKAMGKSQIFLKLEIIKKVVGITIIMSTIWFGVMPVAIGALASSLISTFINAFPNKKLLGYSYFEQIKDIIPSLFVSLLMGAFVYSIQFFHTDLSPVGLLVRQVPIGIFVYFIFGVFFKLNGFKYFLEAAKSLLIRK